ncbi:hypothetical protein H5410_046698 [Solanum commersonii]|uniref:Uncharacterized protein n=1 Tax=Solanum commersonii TaxID=4109 RepID=A0A9J5XH58_SOLCO|nr:hypothetical protein H5410_046698 [Solanum commersonii]
MEEHIIMPIQAFHGKVSSHQPKLPWKVSPSLRLLDFQGVTISHSGGIPVFTDGAAGDFLATSVKITNELDDPPFGQLIAFNVLPFASSLSGSLGGIVLLRGTDRDPPTAPFLAF